MAGNCKKLQFNRKRLGLSQVEFAKLVGVSVGTIYRLEKDETAWAVTRSSTIDKIMAQYDSMASYQPNREEERRRVLGLIEEPEIKDPIVKEAKIVEPEPEVIEEPVHIEEDSLTDKDRQILEFVNFGCERLNKSKTHEDFVTNVEMLYRIIKNQY